MDIVNEKLGSEGGVELAVQDGKIVLTAKDTHASGEVALSVSEDIGYFLDKLAALIPGKVDDAIFEVLKGALKAV